ncbi:MAG: hypothetical protein U0269_11485 [Polyangiales bacterium]
MSQRPSKTPRWQQWTEREARDVRARLDHSEGVGVHSQEIMRLAAAGTVHNGV